jgi:hypothetical protein
MAILHVMMATEDATNHAPTVVTRATVVRAVAVVNRVLTVLEVAAMTMATVPAAVDVEVAAVVAVVVSLTLAIATAMETMVAAVNVAVAQETTMTEIVAGGLNETLLKSVSEI